MYIVMTSFKRSLHLPIEDAWSGAVYQPKGFNYPKAEWADIRWPNGTWIRPREFMDQAKPLLAYHDTLYDHYMQRRDAVETWVEDVGLRIAKVTGEYGPEAAALCCWCPYERAARRQLRDWGSFVCHLSVAGEFLANEFDVPIYYDQDRLQMAVLTQRGLNGN